MVFILRFDVFLEKLRQPVSFEYAYMYLRQFSMFKQMMPAIKVLYRNLFHIPLLKSSSLLY